MNLSDITIPVRERQDWVWAQINARFPEFRRENFPIDDPHTLAGMILDDVCRFVAKPGDVVMDIGANVGVFTTICAVRGARVWAFEPHPQAIHKFLDLICKNRVEQQVTLFGVAVKAEQAEVAFNPSASESDGWLSLNGTTGIGEMLVTARSFREVLKYASEWDCVKMDIEGDEFDVLLSASLDDLRKIKYLTVEFHHNADQVGKYEKVLEHLSKVFTLSEPDARDHIHYTLQATRK